MGGVGEVFVFNDTGQRWDSLPLPGSSDLVLRLAADSAGNLYAAAGVALYRSQDQGDSWTLVSLPVQPRHSVYGISTSAAGTVLVSDGTQFLRSTDNGETWEIITDGPQSAFDIAHCGPDTVFAAVYSRGMYRSDDDGKTWESVNEGLRQGDGYLSLFSVTCRPDGLILTGGIDAGLFYSTDQGGALD